MDWIDCCIHCGCDEDDRIGHDDTCIHGCNDEPEALKKVDEKANVIQLGDHIEMEHEKELPGLWAFTTLWNMHADMHRRSDHWNHEH